MKHRLKISLFLIVIAHILLGGAAVHTFIVWVFINHEQSPTSAINSLNP
jgi:hypothetical protein